MITVRLQHLNLEHSHLWFIVFHATGLDYAKVWEDAFRGATLQERFDEEKRELILNKFFLLLHENHIGFDVKNIVDNKKKLKFQFDLPIELLRRFLRNGVRFTINQKDESLPTLRKVSPPIYDKIKTF